MKKLTKLKRGDMVAILSPSFAAPAVWPHVYELGFKRLKEVFGLDPVEFPATKKLGASKDERAKDLIDAFSNPEIKAVFATLGGDDQVTYVKNLPKEIFADNPKPFFGFSDNSHFANHLWLCGVPSYYGGCIFTQFSMQREMHEFTVKHLNHALFKDGEVELTSSPLYNDIGLNWDDPENLKKERQMEENDGWCWDGMGSVEGTTWGGCLESVDEMLRNNVPIPSLSQFEDVILILETSEEIPKADYVKRVMRALGERGILERVKGLLVGRPKAWNFGDQKTAEEKSKYREEQRRCISEMVRKYNKDIPIVQNLDFGHTDPQIAIPYGGRVRIDGTGRKIYASY